MLFDVTVIVAVNVRAAILFTAAVCPAINTEGGARMIWEVEKRRIIMSSTLAYFVSTVLEENILTGALIAGIPVSISTDDSSVVFVRATPTLPLVSVNEFSKIVTLPNCCSSISTVIEAVKVVEFIRVTFAARLANSTTGVVIGSDAINDRTTSLLIRAKLVSDKFLETMVAAIIVGWIVSLEYRRLPPRTMRYRR